MLDGAKLDAKPVLLLFPEGGKDAVCGPCKPLDVFV